MGALSDLTTVAVLTVGCVYAALQRTAYNDTMNMLTDESQVKIEPVKRYHNVRGLQGTKRGTFDGFLVEYAHMIAFLLRPGRELAYGDFCRRHKLNNKELTYDGFSDEYWADFAQRQSTPISETDV